jgi:DNA-binding NtrC family response regulator
VTRPARILIIDDEPEMADSIGLILERAGYEALVETDGRHALETAASERPDVVLTDLRMPELDGLTLMESLKARQVAAPVLVLTGYASVESAVEAMRRGAVDYLSKPFAPEELLLRVERALAWGRITEQNRYLRERVEAGGRGAEIVGRSPALAEVVRLVEKVAPTDTRILIVGESGTGKELVARAVHRKSRRSELPFFAINCGALAEAPLDSELFGHERGAISGATAAKKGLLEMAHGGTLFLDEISETAAAFQTRLLRVVQDGEFLRVGGTRVLRSDVRIVAGTSRDPRRAVAEGKLREDLFYRLGVVQIELPPLRERPGDVAPLARHFAALYARQIKKRIPGIADEAMQALERYRWPGNVRELENVVERAIIMAEDGRPIGIADLAEDVSAPEPIAIQSDEPMRELREAERDLLLRALREAGGNRSLAARRLGIARRTLYDKLARYQIASRPND